MRCETSTGQNLIAGTTRTGNNAACYRSHPRLKTTAAARFRCQFLINKIIKFSRLFLRLFTDAVGSRTADKSADSSGTTDTRPLADRRLPYLSTLSTD